ncbi:MAG TPA: formyltransferase family protein, partial [Candidatus Sulfotelmatobacter sp.]|nr:formyltransferase family protein [Candidatus Sulfotelmatobacter sp.]
MARLKLAILISGRGSNMQALIGACRAGGIDAEVALVLSNKAEAAGLAYAAAAGIPTRVIPHCDFPDRVSFDAAVDRALAEAGAG